MAPVPTRPDLLIVARDRPELYERFRRMGVRDSDVEIVSDRRQAGLTGPRGMPDRRHRPVDETLRSAGWVMIPGRHRTRPADSTPAPHGADGPTIPPTRSCYVTLDAADLESLSHALPRHSDAYASLQAALDLGNGQKSVRCTGRAAEELLFVARWNCPNAVESIRASMLTAAE